METRGERVLIIDDDEIIVEIIRSTLEKEGVSVFGCMESALALERVRELVPDLILLDIYMPTISGVTLLSQLKADSICGMIPVIMLSSSRYQIDIEAGLANQVSDYLVKPVDPFVLVSKVKSLISRHKKLILIVDDDPIMASILEHKLHSMGYQSLSVCDGNQALNVAKERLPDLILLDRMLPGKEGLSILKELKQDPGTVSIPVIIVSAKNRESDILEALELGAVEYMGKPLKLEELSFRIQRSILR